MAHVEQRSVVSSEWGIAPVPRGRRRLSAVDIAVLWGDLGIGLLVLVTGGLLVPGLGFATALGVILLGSIIGSALLAFAGSYGARHGVPTMVLFRPILGNVGSWVPSFLNAAQLIGWTAVELWAMSSVADLIARRSFGWSNRSLWLVVTAVVTTALALWGPIGVARVWMKRFGAWVISALCVSLSVLLVVNGGLEQALRAPANGIWPTPGAALDLVIAMPVSWLPLVADYNRFAMGPRGAFGGTFAGYALANVWLYALGALLVLGAGAQPTPAGIAAGILAVAGGSLAGVLFLTAVLVGETDEAFADIYSGALSLRNVWPALSQKALVIAIAVAATFLASWLSMARYESFLFLLGSVFVPLFGVLAAHWMAGGRPLQRGAARAVEPLSLVAWGFGAVVYHWISPIGPGWWLELSRQLLGSPLMERYAWLPASIPSFLVGFLVASVSQRFIIRRAHGAR
jgi:NCS1 family nucleobase:cation symporter-1